MVSRKVNIGFIGAGRVSENHFKAVKMCENAEVVAVYDIDREVGIKKAKEWDIAFYDDAECIFSNNGIDAVFILSPLESHYNYAYKAIENGKHVLVEKPVSLNPAEISNLSKVSKNKNVVCMPGHSYIYLPEIARIVKCAKNGLFKKLAYLYISEIYRMPLNFIKLYHGPLIEVFWHAAYLIISILGMPENVSAFSSCIRKDEIQQFQQSSDQIIVSAKFNNDALAQVFISWAIEDETSDPWTFIIKVLGEDGGIGFSRRAIVANILNNKLPREYPLYEEMFEKEIDYFINQCILKDIPPLSTLDDAFYTCLLVKAVNCSIVENKIVSLKMYLNEVNKGT